MNNVRRSPAFNGSACRLGMGLVVLTLALAGCGRGLTPGAAVPGGALAAAKKPVSTTGAAEAYYRSIATASGRPLLLGLNKIIRRQRVHTYDEARDFQFGAVDDTDGSNTVHDVYCGRVAKGVTGRKTAFERGLNTEHSWPQSMGAKEVPARSDLHHLFPVDNDTNSLRNNHPYGTPQKVEQNLPDFSGDGQHARFGETNGHKVFEPRPNHRGDAARAMLYFYVRYAAAPPEPAVKVTLDNYRLEFATLWRWHFMDPVSAKEIARNEAIYKVQGNRNPFIDHPEWVAKLGGLLAPSAGRLGELEDLTAWLHITDVPAPPLDGDGN